VHADLGALEAMAALARQTGSVVHVVVPRVPGAAQHARQVAAAAGVAVSVDLMAGSLRARFDARQAV
jgi:pyruvoyl-dependent arginine decarboxylase (PvlArgDC)